MCLASHGHTYAWTQCCQSEHNNCINSRQLLIESDRVVFLGDSITFNGHWVSYLTCWMESAGTKARVINMALPSETVSGLSENGHAGGKFPRPDLHERLDRVLRISRPDVVLACYGMNCGIYQPFDTERFKKFREGSIRLHEKVEGIGPDHSSHSTCLRSTPGQTWSSWANRLRACS